MIGKTFLGVLKKYENVRIDGNVCVKIVIKHINESSIQAFLTPFAKKLGVSKIENLFECPVRWKKMVIDTYDYTKKTYDVTFGQVEFTADLNEIGISRKLVDGTDVFEYSLHLEKDISTDHLDRLVAEAYLNYREENEAGREVFKEFDVRMELSDKKKVDNDDSSIL